jgi:hypothetical protein
MITWLAPAISLTELHRIKRWQVDHALEHPVEYQTWDAVLTTWFMGWVGWLPTWALDLWWCSVPCPLGMLAPRLYIGWRARAHAQHRLRCDWLPEVRGHAGESTMNH